MDNLSFFDQNKEEFYSKSSPLAVRMRPESLSEYAGQRHVLGKDKPLYRMIKANRISSMILYGPPGTGKTTLAYIIAKTSNMNYEHLSAVAASKADIMEVVKKAQNHMSMFMEKTLLFIDEIHRFNKLQQDVLLPYVEDGLIILIGATTENPYFEVNKALLSRCHLIQLEPLSEEDLRFVIKRALEDENKGFGKLDITIDQDAIDYLVNSSHSDARALLNSLEIAILSTDKKDGKISVSIDDMRNSIIKKTSYYDKDGDTHYDTISAFIKSMRGSDPNATIYYLAKMISAGEEIKFIARRLMIFASEDVGLADPNALNIASSAFIAIDAVGNPEARIILSNAALYMALAPKSNTSYMAIDDALSFINNNPPYQVPDHLRDSHYAGSKELGHGLEYKYPHNYNNGYVIQNYLPDKISDVSFYNGKNVGYEAKINDRLNRLKEYERNKDVN
ncbi:MAG: replication-associated recombination protein A [Tissierellia bacterium]|nr:replication-associated recombination protein A [Tissierellia bacterium]